MNDGDERRGMQNASRVRFLCLGHTDLCLCVFLALCHQQCTRSDLPRACGPYLLASSLLGRRISTSVRHKSDYRHVQSLALSTENTNFVVATYLHRKFTADTNVIGADEVEGLYRPVACTVYTNFESVAEGKSTMTQQFPQK